MKILCVCSAGQNRSKHLAGFLHEQGYETDFAGVHPLSMNKITQSRIDWADVIVVVMPWMIQYLKHYDTEQKNIITLDIPNKRSLYPRMEKEALTAVRDLS